MVSNHLFKSMKSTLHRLIATSAILVGFGFTAIAAENKSVSPADTALIAKARTNYPLKTCLVSGEDLGAMGEATAYIHRVAGQPDRVVFFCCDGCSDDFKKEPAKFLTKLDAAAKTKSAPKS